MKRINIMIVEDESIIALNIKETLLELGYGVTGIAPNTEKSLMLLEDKCPDLILMDIFLKDGDSGIELAKIINTKYDIPIIYLTANSESQTISQASKSAPYGYVVKPFKGHDLHSAIEVAIQRFSHDKKQKDAFDTVKSINLSLQTKIEENQESKSKLVQLKHGYIFDREERILYHAQEKVNLTEREISVINALCLNVGHIISIDQIEAAAWQDKPAGYASLRSLLFRLRAKLPKDIIENVSGRGYKINKA